MSCSAKIRAQKLPWNSGVELVILSHDGTSVCYQLMMCKVVPESAIEPTVKIGITEAQVLMDDLWNAGIRPTEGTGSAGSLRATERHLEDMRRLIFGAKGHGGNS